MTKVQRITLSAFLLVLLAGFLFYEMFWKEPLYQGKSLSDWLIAFDQEPSDEQVRAVEAVQNMGRKCLGTLFGMLEATDSPGYEKVAGFVNEYTVFKMKPPTPSERQRNRAYFGLAALSRQQCESIKRQLRKELYGNQWHPDMAVLLAFLGTNGLPPLIEALKNRSPDVRRSAVSALSFPQQMIAHQTNQAVLRVFATCGLTADELRVTAKAFAGRVTVAGSVSR